jgi:hypothetical protein
MKSTTDEPGIVLCLRELQYIILNRTKLGGKPIVITNAACNKYKRDKCPGERILMTRKQLQ